MVQQNYFHIYAYLAKFLDISAKSFFLRRFSSCQYHL